MKPSRHWAADLVGRAWTPDYRCWDLVREVFLVRYGIEMPIVAVGEEGNESSILRASRVSGWVRAEGPAREGDIVLMDRAEGRHVGCMIDVRGRPMLLHNSGTMGADGRPRGGVICQPLADAAGGRPVELWRRRAP